MLREQRDVEPREMWAARVGLGGLFEEHEGEEPSQSYRHQVDHDTGDDVVDAEGDGGHRMHRRENAPQSSAEQESEDHSTGAQTHPIRAGPAKRATPAAPETVPMIIRPSRPMFTIPDRSLNSPPETGQIEDREVRERDRGRRAEIADVHQASSASAAGTSVSRIPTSAPARCSSAPGQPAPGDLMHDHHAEDQDPLQDDQELPRERRSDLQSGLPPGDHRPAGPRRTRSRAGCSGRGTPPRSP